MADPRSHKSYRPLTVLSFRANYYANGRQVRGYHVVNVALHCACSVLVAVVASRVMRITAIHACLAAMLFAAHPVHTEAVSSIVGRAEVLCCFFFLLSFLCYHWQICSQCIRDVAYRCITDHEFVTLVALTTSLLCFRLWILQGSFPEFSEMDNPASFSSMRTTRLLTYSYLCAFNAWLLLCPSTLSYDWQMGSIPLVTSPFECRNLATMAILALLLALGWRALTTSKTKNDHRRHSICGRRIILPSQALLSSAPMVHYEPLLHSSAALCYTHLEPERRLGIQRGPVRVLNWSRCCLLFAFVEYMYMRSTTHPLYSRSGIRDLPENAKMHYNYANLQKDIANTDSAIKHYRLAIELWPDHASAHNNLGTVLSSAEESEHHFRHALRVNPNHPGAHFNLANIYSKQGQKDVARTLLERAVELDPDFCEAYSSLAALAAERGDIAEAERLHQMALSSDDRNADARNNYGTFLQSHGRAEEAMEQYQQALDIQQNHTVALLNAARSLRSMNLNRQAESLYKRALAVEPDPQVMDNLAVFYINAGRLDEARKLFEDIDRLFPEHRDGKVHYAQLLIRLRSFRAAEDLLLDVIEHNSTDRGALHTAALLYNHINRTVESYEAAIRLDPDLAHAHLNLAVIRHLESDYPGAFRHYQVALSLDPKNKLIVDNMAKLRRRITRPLPFHDCV
ncbi:hypothetical protein MTO96_026745 [Rhipicephalus appendiculatus]